MGRISATMADLTILTAEDPRTESISAILTEIAQGAISQGAMEGKDLWRIPDRGEALRFAVHAAQPGDIVLALGKGHEQSMCFGDIEHPWDDRRAIRSVLSELLNLEGPQLPHLPTSK
jgi:UDP-N-acetylmuramoyl-L-alanyl-D-glutamate--2,6-diaminopimelate ligase